MVFIMVSLPRNPQGLSGLSTKKANMLRDPIIPVFRAIIVMIILIVLSYIDYISQLEYINSLGEVINICPLILLFAKKSSRKAPNLWFGTILPIFICNIMQGYSTKCTLFKIIKSQATTNRDNLIIVGASLMNLISLPASKLFNLKLSFDIIKRLIIM